MGENILCLALAYTFGEIVRLTVMASTGWHHHGKISLVRWPHFGDFSESFMAIGWMGMMVCAACANTYIDFLMVGHLKNGSATLVEYAGRLHLMPIIVFNGMLVVLLGDWSRNEGGNLTWDKIQKGALLTGGLSIVLCVIIIITRGYWLPIVFLSSQFPEQQYLTINNLMFWYLLGGPFVITTNVISRGFLVWRKFKLLTCIGILSVFINVIFNKIFINIYGVKGVAMSTMGLDVAMLIISVIIGLAIKKDKMGTLDVDSKGLPSRN